MPESFTVVRNVSYQDLGRVFEIEASSFAEPFPFHFFEEMLKADSGTFLVAVHNNETAGYIVASVEEKESHILSVAVDPAKRREGIGAALMTELTRKLEAMGVLWLHLEVRRGDVGARAFYNRVGFRETKILKGYYGHEDGIFMVRMLGATGRSDKHS